MSFSCISCSRTHDVSFACEQKGLQKHAVQDSFLTWEAFKDDTSETSVLLDAFTCASLYLIFLLILWYELLEFHLLVNHFTWDFCGIFVAWVTSDSFICD